MVVLKRLAMCLFAQTFGKLLRAEESVINRLDRAAEARNFRARNRFAGEHLFDRRLQVSLVSVSSGNLKLSIAPRYIEPAFRSRREMPEGFAA